jgi:hypothetical protein
MGAGGTGCRDIYGSRKDRVQGHACTEDGVEDNGFMQNSRMEQFTPLAAELELRVGELLGSCKAIVYTSPVSRNSNGCELDAKIII